MEVFVLFLFYSGPVYVFLTIIRYELQLITEINNKGAKMKSVSIILNSVIALGLSIGMISAGILQTSMNIFLILTVQFVLFACITFLVYEKRILKNINEYYKNGLLLGIFLTITVICNAYAIKFLSPAMAGIFILIPVSMFITNNIYARYTAAALATAAAVFISFIYCMFSPLGLIAGLLSALSMYFMINYFTINSEHIRKGIIETGFTATGLTAVTVTVLFLLTRPGTAAILSPFQQIHLLLLILTGTLIPYSILIYRQCTFSRLGILFFMTVFTMTLIFKSMRWLFFIPYLLLFTPFATQKKHKKAFSTVETFAIIALLGIVVSLVAPVINGINRINTVHEDRSILETNNIPANVLQIGNICIKYIDKRPKYIYQYSDSKFYSVPIR